MSILMLRFAKQLHIRVNSFEIGPKVPCTIGRAYSIYIPLCLQHLLHTHIDILNKCKHTAIEKCYIRSNRHKSLLFERGFGKHTGNVNPRKQSSFLWRSDFHSLAFVWNTESMVNLFTLVCYLTALILMSLHVQCQMVRSAERSVAMSTFKWLCASMFPKMAR